MDNSIALGGGDVSGIRSASHSSLKDKKSAVLIFLISVDVFHLIVAYYLISFHIVASLCDTS